MRKVISLGKVDYNRSGRRNCPAKLEIEWNGGRFTACGSIWNPRHTDIYAGGQIVEEVCAYFPHNTVAQRVLAVWRDWHLNDLKAGSPAQEAWLKANPVNAVYPESRYERARDALAAAGLNPDPGYLHNGRPYSYGSAWLTAEIPADVVTEIESIMAV